MNLHDLLIHFEPEPQLQGIILSAYDRRKGHIEYPTLSEALKGCVDFNCGIEHPEFWEGMYYSLKSIENGKDSSK